MATRGEGLRYRGQFEVARLKGSASVATLRFLVARPHRVLGDYSEDHAAKQMRRDLEALSPFTVATALPERLTLNASASSGANVVMPSLTRPHRCNSLHAGDHV